MLEAFLWWLTLLLIGWAAFPISHWLLRFLPDRGYAFSRPLGLLLLAYPFWLLITAGMLPNSQVGAAAAAVLLLIAGGIVAARSRRSLGLFLRRRSGLVLATELVWLAVFALWGVIRSHTAAIVHTEQPMDFALLNGILRSPGFPPQDPWSAGQSISYYYGGYLIAAYLTHLTAIASSITYNLNLMSTVAMAAAAVFGLVYGLAATHRAHRHPVGTPLRVPEASKGPRGIPASALGCGVLAVFLLVFIGNLEGVLEYLRAMGTGAPLLRWVQIDGLTPTGGGGQWYPNDYMFWWRSSRVINTFVDGQGIDYTITEVPFFSFLLGDMHPHVMSLPFVMLALAAGYNVLRGRSAPGLDWVKTRPAACLLLALVFGSLGFINTWDLPTCLALLLGVVVLRVAHERAAGRRAGYVSALGLWAVIGAGALLLYAPFYAHLESQASGVLPLRRVMTRQVHFLIVLGPVLLPSLLFLGAAWWGAFRNAAVPSAGRLGAAWAALLPLAAFALWAVAELGMGAVGSERLLPPEAMGGLRESLLAIGSRFWHLLPLLLAASLGLLTALRMAAGPRRTSEPTQFAALLAALALTLALGADLFHVADFFGNRMNTVFKFYYQVWLLLAVAGAFGVSVIFHGKAGRSVALVAVAVVLLAAFAFVPPAVAEKTGGLSGRATQDGLDFLKQGEPSEYAAVQWLWANGAPGDVIVEGVPGSGAPSGDYDAAAARISQRTGLPTVLGWPGHEHQWRGNPFEPIQERYKDVETVYRTGGAEEIRGVLEKYTVRYVIVGGLERRLYGPAVAGRFQGLATPVFAVEGMTVLEVDKA